jgi:hypothetical protein
MPPTGGTLRLTHMDKVVVPVPMYHCFGMVMGVLAAVCHGAAVVVPSPVFDAAAALSAVHTHRATALLGVPTMFIGVCMYVHVCVCVCVCVCLSPSLTYIIITKLSWSSPTSAATTSEASARGACSTPCNLNHMFL